MKALIDLLVNSGPLQFVLILIGIALVIRIIWDILFDK